MRSIQFEIPDSPALLPGYPVECYRSSYTYGMCASLHWHYFSEIIYVHEGSQEVTAGNHIDRLHQGDLIYINPEQVHLAYSGDQRETSLTVLKFDPSLLCSPVGGDAEEPLLTPFLDRGTIQSLAFPAARLPGRVSVLLEELVHLTGERAYGYEFRVRSLLCELVWLLAVTLRENGGYVVSGAPLSEQELERFRAVLRTINEQYMQPIPLSELTEICNLSYSSFAVKFKSLTGKTPVEYINHVRVSQAQKLLLTSGATISEIAGACGFGDVCYFSRVFRRISGNSPLEFRRGIPTNG